MTNLNTVEIQGNYRKSSTALKAFESCLRDYYSVINFKRNEWRFKKVMERAEHQMNTTGEANHEGAQWGGKWGNYSRKVALNSRGVYEFVAGFNTHKELGF